MSAQSPLSALPSRRMVMLGLTAIGGVASLPALAAQSIKIRDLWAVRGEFSALAKGLAGQAVSMRGYMAPPLKPEIDFFVLTRIPMAVCPFCDTEASWPDDLVLVKVPDTLSPVPFNDLITATGILELGTKTDEGTGFVSRIRLVGADFARA